MTLSQTTVRFIQGVPFDNSYAHTRWFQSRTEQYNYFTSFPSIQRTQNNFQKSTGRMAIEVSEHVETMMNYDYMMYRNASYGNKWFYAFVLNVEHVSRNTTRVYFEVDPIQTYMFDVDIKPSYVVREHESVSDNYYPESMQKGSEYETVKTWDIKPYPFYFLVVATKRRIDRDYEDGVGTLESKNDGTFRGSPDSLNYYWYPVPRSARPFTMNGAGQTPIAPNIDEVKEILRLLRTYQGMVDNVVSIYVTDYLPLDITNVGDNYSDGGSIQETIGWDLPDRPTATMFRVFSYSTNTQHFNHHAKYIEVGNVFEELNETEPKLRYFPYTLIEVSDGRGNLVNFKPEGFLNLNGNLSLRIMGGITHQNTVAYGLQGYNKSNDLPSVLDTALINTDPQDLAIVNSQSASYLQGAKNSMQAKQNTWGSLQNYQELSAGNRMFASAGNILGGMAGLGMGALNMGYGINMLSTGMGNLVQGGFDHMQAGIDYENKIAEQNAVVEDLRNLPPSLQKQGNNPNMNIGYDMHGVRIRIKRILPQYLDRARDHLKMFGTKVNRLKQPNIRTRTHFNYVQTTMLNVQSPIYNDDILRFKHIFDQGITLWHTNDIHNYNVANNRR